MEALERRVEYYETEDGRHPFKEWLDKLHDTRGQAKTHVRIGRVSLGNLGFCRSVGGGVMELKIDYGPGYRVYFGCVGDQLIILLCGGDKSSQKHDIKIAREYWSDYRRRHG